MVKSSQGIKPCNYNQPHAPGETAGHLVNLRPHFAGQADCSVLRFLLFWLSLPAYVSFKHDRFLQPAPAKTARADSVLIKDGMLATTTPAGGLVAWTIRPPTLASGLRNLSSAVFAVHNFLPLPFMGHGLIPDSAWSG